MTDSIAVFGGTGGVGLETIYQALQSGNKVRALVRSPQRLVVPPGSGGEAKAGMPLESPDLEVIQGDVTKLEDVQKVFEKGDVEGVVVALGGKTSEVGLTMLTDGTKNILQCMKDKNVKPVSIVTSLGTGDSYDQAPFVFKLVMWTVLRDAFVDKNNQEDLIKSQGADLDYTIVRPAGLGLGPPTGQFKVMSALDPGKAGVIQRSDVAAFCLRMLKEDTYNKQAVGITNIV